MHIPLPPLFCLVILLSCLFNVEARAEKRIALIIGNSSYQHVPRLANPISDATAVADTLKRAGFDSVDLRRDLTISDMRRVLRDFSNNSRDAHVAVLYFAGHGIEVDGTNYLIPTDATLEQDSDVYDETISLDRGLAAIEPAKQLRLVILDACRDNPFARSMKRTVASRAVGRGLAKVEPASPNTLIAFASKAGSTASDGDSGHSPFTAALVQHIAKPGLDLRKAFGFVRDDVLNATKNVQEPYVYGSLGGNDVPLIPATPADASSASSPPEAAVQRFYEYALQVNTKAAWDAFLETYPSGFFAVLAKERRDKLAEQSGTAASAGRAKEADQKTSLTAAPTKTDAPNQLPERAESQKLPLGSTADQKVDGNAISEPDRMKSAAIDPSVAKATDQASRSTTDLARSLQAQLKRVGCYTGAVNGDWDSASQKALGLFNRHAGTQLDVKLASVEAEDFVKERPRHTCPLSCAPGYRAESDGCAKIVCSKGFQLTPENTCERTASKEQKPQEQKSAEPTRPSPPTDRNKSAAQLMKDFTNSPTCSNIRIACEKSLSPGHCAASYAQCMQTGRWKSGVSQYEGLARQ
ncbi:caspase family protein [Bradyrhizobium sp. HKCCYLS2038]|uniref:caspase family protein n=1 Tax=unclassified Bradyrhizobium TaxID=2631580 RepID=UPI003EBCA7DB